MIDPKLSELLHDRALLAAITRLAEWHVSEGREMDPQRVLDFISSYNPPAIDLVDVVDRVRDSNGELMEIPDGDVLAEMGKTCGVRMRERAAEVNVMLWTGENVELLAQMIPDGCVHLSGASPGLELKVFNGNEQLWIPVPIGHYIVNNFPDSIYPLDPETLALHLEPAWQAMSAEIRTFETEENVVTTGAGPNEDYA